MTSTKAPALTTPHASQAQRTARETVLQQAAQARSLVSASARERVQAPDHGGPDQAVILAGAGPQDRRGGRERELQVPSVEDVSRRGSGTQSPRAESVSRN